MLLENKIMIIPQKNNSHTNDILLKLLNYALSHI